MPLDAEKPVARLRRFVRLLGWQAPLRMYQHQIGADASPRNLRGRVIRWYETGVSKGGKLDCFLMIHEAPQGQTLTYVGAVYAIRYRICTGWHGFRLFAADAELETEATRLAPWLAHEWFATLEKRRVFRQIHPECVGFTWRRIANEGVPRPKE